jgi:spoIIIJ-associated protein
MSGFLSKLFGGGKKKSSEADSTIGLVEEVLQGLIERGALDLSYEVNSHMNGEIEEINIELTGNDEKLLIEKEGALLDSLQLFIKRVVQHQLPDARVNVNFDSNGYREESNRSLLDLADKLKERALEQGRSVYLRALPPKDRKVIHQYLANDERVRSRSVGEGLYKKIKIYPVKNAGASQDDSADEIAADNA